MEDNLRRELPRFESLEAFTDFFDNNDMGDYLESLPEVNFEVVYRICSSRSEVKIENNKEED